MIMGNYTLPTILTDNVNVILDSIKREKDIPAELRIAIYNTVIERIKFRIHKNILHIICVLYHGIF